MHRHITCTHRIYNLESLQMGKGDMVLTRISKVTLAAASHLSNTLDFRKPSDVAFTATLSSGEHPISKRMQPEVRCTYTWQLNRTPSKARMGICDARKEGWYLVIIFSLMALLVFTAKMLQRVYRIGRRTFFFFSSCGTVLSAPWLSEYKNNRHGNRSHWQRAMFTLWAACALWT